MPRRQIFYSFHYDNDVMRVQQIRNIGMLDGNNPVSANEWETVRRGGDAAVKRWIDENMRNRSCVVVLIGSETAHRPYVQYEIAKAWNDGKGVLGIYIHNINCPRNGTCRKGPNPFDYVKFQNGTALSSVVRCYDPNALNVYINIKNNLETWIESAISSRG